MKTTSTFHPALRALSAVALLAAQPTFAAVTFSQIVLDKSATATGAEILNDGTLIEANHFGSPPNFLTAAGPVTLDNGLKFSNSTTSINIGGIQNATNSDSKGFTPLTTGNFDAFAGTYIWIAYGFSSSSITIPGLVIGQQYRLQMISFSAANAAVTVEDEPVSWSNTNSLLTATWTAGDTIANVNLRRTGEEIHFNGYSLHAIPEPSAALLGGLGALALLRRRRNA